MPLHSFTNWIPFHRSRGHQGAQSNNSTDGPVDHEQAQESNHDASNYARKLSSAPEDFLTRRDAEHDLHQDPANQAGSPSHQSAITYFLYGSFTNPATICTALGRSSAPTLRPAQVKGYCLSDYTSEHGADKALHDGGADQVVEGVAVVVEGEEEEERLADHCYQGGGYFEEVACHIFFLDNEGEGCVGRVWKWEDTEAEDDEHHHDEDEYDTDDYDHYE